MLTGHAAAKIVLDRIAAARVEKHKHHLGPMVT
jgi:hypothetical protein